MSAADTFIGTFDLDELAYLKKDAKPYTVISLFSGCGGFDLGTHQAGFETRVMVEWEKAACDTLRSNWTREGHIAYCDGMIAALRAHPNEKRKYGRSPLDGFFLKKKVNKGKFQWHGPDSQEDRDAMVAELEKSRDKKKWAPWAQKREPAILQEDITKLPTAKILEAAELRVGEATLLTGGFPCQGFSTANGNRDKNDYTKDKRNFLYLECVRVIREALPKTFALENVKGLISMEKGRVIRMICDDLAAVGYNVTWDLLNAADYGVPQNRWRVFFMGERNDVLVVGPERPQLHIGGAPGHVKHPDWFLQGISKSKWEQKQKVKAAHSSSLQLTLDLPAHTDQ